MMSDVVRSAPDVIYAIGAGPLVKAATTTIPVVTLTGDPISPRKEAGFVFNNPLNDGGEFIVNTDGHEFVAFGGFLPFYAFPRNFNSGDTVTMGLTVFKDSNGKNAIIYSAATATTFVRESKADICPCELSPHPTTVPFDFTARLW